MIQGGATLAPERGGAGQSAGAKPRLLVVVDTEEEFDWTQFDANSTSIRAMSRQVIAQNLLSAYGIQPAYLMTYPVAANPEGHKPLMEFLDDGLCHVGAHLHPWVTPPIEEEVSARNSFANNLPPELEARKLDELTRVIEANLKIRPKAFRAGRYGLGTRTLAALERLGYEVDLSIFPRMDLSRMGGPDFTEYGVQPFWGGDNGQILCLPSTSEFIGPMSSLPAQKLNITRKPWAETMRIPPVLARLGLLSKTSLNLESVPLAEAKALVRHLMGRGVSLFVLSYHSTALLPGCTPYVKNQADLDRFLGRLKGFFDFFLGEIGGTPTSPAAERKLFQAQRDKAKTREGQP